MKKILCVVETANRGTLEEQDDAALWFTHALKQAGGSMGVLLRGSAVNYAVRHQDPAGLVIGKTGIERPCYPQRDLVAMKESGIPIYIVKDDVEERGLAVENLVQGFEMIPFSRVPEIFDRYDQVWHW